jgi:hypothetical protein
MAPRYPPKVYAGLLNADDSIKKKLLNNKSWVNDPVTLNKAVDPLVLKGDTTATVFSKNTLRRLINRDGKIRHPVTRKIYNYRTDILRLPPGVDRMFKGNVNHNRTRKSKVHFTFGGNPLGASTKKMCEMIDNAIKMLREERNRTPNFNRMNNNEVNMMNNNEINYVNKIRRDVGDLDNMFNHTERFANMTGRTGRCERITDVLVGGRSFDFASRIIDRAIDRYIKDKTNPGDIVFIPDTANIINILVRQDTANIKNYGTRTLKWDLYVVDDRLELVSIRDKLPKSLSNIDFDSAIETISKKFGVPVTNELFKHLRIKQAKVAMLKGTNKLPPNVQRKIMKRYQNNNA